MLSHGESGGPVFRGGLFLLLNLFKGGLCIVTLTETLNGFQLALDRLTTVGLHASVNLGHLIILDKWSDDVLNVNIINIVLPLLGTEYFEKSLCRSAEAFLEKRCQYGNDHDTEDPCSTCRAFRGSCG